MTRAQARELAGQYLSQFSTAKTPLALLGDEKTQDRDWCYVLPWNTARYVQSRNLADSIGPGTGPIVVVKETGDTWMMGSALPPEEELAMYAEEHGIAQ